MTYMSGNELEFAVYLVTLMIKNSNLFMYSTMKDIYSLNEKFDIIHNGSCFLFLPAGSAP